MAQICDVKREMYVPSVQEYVASVARGAYLGKGLRRWEELTNWRTSDWPDTIRNRFSEDNGKTWSAWQLLYNEWPEQNGHVREEMPWCNCYDPVAQKTIEMIFQRIVIGDGASAMIERWEGKKRYYYDHGFYRLSDDDGLNWEEMRQFTYQDGPSFEEANWGNAGYLKSNNMYGGYNAIALHGKIIYPASRKVPCSKEDNNHIPADLTGLREQSHSSGVFCFIGQWNPKLNDYTWKTTEPLSVPKYVSTRGLFEPAIAELTNGDLLLDMRGSNWRMHPETTPGRRWVSISKDRGNTWSEVTDLRYDTGEQFYAPSSHSRMIRSTKTGKLYWVGNISEEPACANLPRYPLYIAEVDETLPALKRETLTVIDDRDPERDSEYLQLSNFSLLENRETLDLEVYVTRLGERGDQPDLWTADTVKYTLTL